MRFCFNHPGPGGGSRGSYTVKMFKTPKFFPLVFCRGFEASGGQGWLGLTQLMFIPNLVKKSAVVHA